MRIAAHIGVKDEIELIERCIGHLVDIGISQFVVCDMYSTDGTAELLHGLISDRFRVIKVSNKDAGETWLRVNERAVRDLDCDWILFLDADEFPLPKTGHLGDALSENRADLLRLPRFNVPLVEGSARMSSILSPEHYDDIDLFVRPIPNIRKVLADDPSVAWIRTMPIHKIAVRPHAVGRLVQGIHDVIAPDGVEVTRKEARDVVVAHLPLSTPERFKKKMKNIEEFFRYNGAVMGPHLAWHWRRWNEMDREDQILREFKQSVLDAATIENLRREGIVMSAAAVLARSAPDPEAACPGMPA